MDNKNYSSCETDNFMEWEEEESIETLGACFGEDGTSSLDTNDASGHTFSQPSTSGCTGQKRKYSFSSPLPSKISRSISNWEQQQEGHPFVNAINLNYNHEISSRATTASFLPQMLQAEPRCFSSQVTSDNISSELLHDGTDHSEGNISTDFANQTSSCDPNISSEYILSQPSTSGDSSGKKNSFCSPSAANSSRGVWSGKQQNLEHSTFYKTNPYNNSEVAFGSDIAQPVHQMMHEGPPGISSQATSDNKAVLINDDSSCSNDDISIDSILAIGVDSDLDRPLVSPTKFGREREIIFLILDAEGANFEIEDLLVEEIQPDTERCTIFHEREELFWNSFDIPEPYRKALRKHLRNHKMDTMPCNASTRAIALSCPICKKFVMLNNPHFLLEYDH